MNLIVRFAGPDDLDFTSCDGYVPAEVMARKICLGEVVVPARRRQSVGRALLGFICQHLKAAGHRCLLSSSTQDEPEPQEWHRHLGFRAAGAITGINAGGLDEVFFRLDL